MALTVIDEPSFGGRLGAAVGGGLSGLMENLVQKKAQELQRNKRAMGYEQGFGLNKEAAQMLAGAPDDFQQLALKSLIEAQQNEQFQKTLNPEQFSGLGAMGAMGQQQHPSLEQAMQSLGTGVSGEPSNAIEMALQKGLPKLLQQEQISKPAALPQEPLSKIGPQAVQQQQKQKEGKTLQDTFKNRPLSPQLAIKAEEFKQRERLLERKLSATEQQKVDAETLPTYKEVNKAAKAAKESNARLSRMKHLLDKGNVQTHTLLRGLRTLGHIPYLGPIFNAVNSMISNPDTQEFEKLSSEFVKDAKPFFGNRMTQQEVELYLKTVPNLLQSAAGQKRVIRNLQIFNDAADLRQKAMSQIIKDNGGKRPRDLDELIEDRIGNNLDALHQEFIEGPTLSKKGLSLFQ